MRPVARIIKECVICEKEFTVLPSLLRCECCSSVCRYKLIGNRNKGKKCHSNEWKQKLRERLLINNPVNNPEVKEKIRKWNLGKKYSSEINKKKGSPKGLNPNWKGGKTQEWLKFRSSISSQLSSWYNQVKKNDNYTCTSCGCKDKTILQSHHIKPVKDYPELVLDLNNGTTLCRPCHKKVHYG
jgi:hypothetical protein